MFMRVECYLMQCAFELYMQKVQKLSNFVNGFVVNSDA